MRHKKLSMNLQDAIGPKDNEDIQYAQHETENNISNKANTEKKKSVPFYVHPNLHEAMHLVCFAERKKNMNMQKLLIEGLDLLFKEKGYPSVADIIDGKKTIKI